MRISLLRRLGTAAFLAATGVTLLVAQESVSSGVTFQDLLQGYKNPARWLNFSGDYSGQRHSPLKQITPDNAHSLTAQWAFQTGVIPRRGFEGTPLVADGVMMRPAHQQRLGPRRSHRPSVLALSTSAADRSDIRQRSPVNRGFGLLGDRLHMLTLDAHLVSLNAKTGTVLWDSEMADYGSGMRQRGTAVVWDKQIVGIRGNFPRVGSSTRDPKTGARIWRFYTVRDRARRAARHGRPPT